MKTLTLNSFKLLQNSKLYLFGIAVCLSGLHLILTWRVSSDVDRLIIGALLWGAILCLLWRKQDRINLKSGILSSFFGFLLITLVLIKSISLFWFESDFLRLAPLLVSFGLSMLASGVKGLKQYWRELLIVLLLSVPESLLSPLIEGGFKVTVLTANFSGFLLWYLGFKSSVYGVNIILPNGTVAVNTPCTGINAALLLLKLTVVFILVFPTDWNKKILMPIGAVLIAFVCSGIRVAIMAVVVSNQEAFDYWHGPEGSQIFSTLSIFLFGLFCRFSRSPDTSTSQNMELQ